MFRTASQLHGLVVSAVDGEIGEVDSLLFDDVHWVVRHLVVDTGRWLPGRQVLIAPASVQSIEDDPARIGIGLTREKIEKSPGVETDRPVSRQKELELARYYGYTPYGGIDGVVSGAYYPPAVPVPPLEGRGGAASDPAASRADDVPTYGDPHLRSTRAVKGYHIEATDEAIGHIETFVVDDRTWTITHIFLDTSNWPGGHTHIIPTAWIARIDWSTMKAFLSVPAAAVRNRPEVETSTAIRADLEPLLQRDLDAAGRDMPGGGLSGSG